MLRPHGWKPDRIPSSTAQVGAAWWPLWLDSGRVIQLPVTTQTRLRNSTTSSLPHMRHSVGNRRTRPDRRNAETGSETWKNRRGNLVGIRIEVRLVQKTFKSRWEPGRIVNSMQMEMSLAKSPNKVCFYKDLHVVSLIVWAVFFQFVTIVNFVIKLFFFCIRFMNSAHTCFTNAYNFSNKVCLYKDLLQ